MRFLRHCSRGWPVVTLFGVALVLLAPATQAQDDPVTVTVEVTGDPVPGGTVTATATVEITDGSTVESYSWTQEEGVAAAITGTDTDTVTVTLGDLAGYKDMLFHVIAEPPIDEDEFPDNVPAPEGEFPGGLQDRFEVVGLNPFSLEEAALVELEVEVVTTSGTYHGKGEIHAALPWKPTTGVRNVGIGLPVLLHGKTQDSYDWMLTPPGGSSAVLADAATQNPEFVPDVAGHYQLEVTDMATDSTVALSVYAGTWRGVITGKDADGRPEWDASCSICHNGTVALDAFTTWAQTGHAEIFSSNLDTSTHYGESCFSCHTVGFDTDVANGGIDDAADYQAFLDAGLLNVPGDNWTTVLDQFPHTAQLANIQCENCHGPQDSDAHMKGAPRQNLSSNVCGSCHGEPARHARFQQWQVSAHANYELAIDEGDSGSCSRCHTGNGFLAWLPVLLGEEAGDPLDDVEVTWTADETHPQTCQTCHDPHSIGTVSGDETNATVRISGDTPPLIAGFTATDVGKGAICMTCHNTRRGLRNDSTFSQFYGTSEAARAPHGGAQADVLMGQNAYLATVPSRGMHSMLEDACVTCHMEETPPPAALSYNQGGTNHTFYARNDICSSCHGDAVVAADVQGPTMASLTMLQDAIEQEIYDLIDVQIAAGNTINLDDEATITSVTDIDDIVFGDSHGRQAITVTLTDASVLGPYSMSDVEVVPASGDAFDLYDVANPNLIKAGWNWILINNDGSMGVHNPSWVSSVLSASLDALASEVEPCVEDGDTLCLNQDRFTVEVNWRDFQDQTGSGMAAACGSDDTGIFYFFTEDNWEMMVKVLNGCAINDHYWVFFAATTNVEFTLSVTDTVTGMVKAYNNHSQSYTNPLGQPANAVTDTEAFATCP